MRKNGCRKKSMNSAPIANQFGLCSVMFGPEFAGGDQELRETTLTAPLEWREPVFRQRCLTAAGKK